jgi:hypothetical protein
MAIANSSIGTYMGVPVQMWGGVGKPRDGDMYLDHQNMAYKVYFNNEFHEVDMTTPQAMEILLRNIQNQDQITDEYLEQEYPDLGALKEQYDELRDKYKTFEILKKDYE